MTRALSDWLDDIPPTVTALAGLPGGREWVASLPAKLERCADRWSLEVGAAYPDSFVSLVVDAVDADGSEVVLKIQYPHRESDAEADALRLWDGRGAIRLIDHHEDDHALLLERCHPGTHLSRVEAGEALSVLVGLLPRLLVPANEPFTPLRDEALRWVDGLEAEWERNGRPFERRLVDAAVEALTALAETQTESVLLHQDLHADNVIAARREPWLVIDPKPLAGERAFACAPIIRSFELGHSRANVLGRLDLLSQELELDRERVRGWALGQTVAWSMDNDETMARHTETARWLVDA